MTPAATEPFPVERAELLEPDNDVVFRKISGMHESPRTIDRCRADSPLPSAYMVGIQAKRQQFLEHFRRELKSLARPLKLRDIVTINKLVTQTLNFVDVVFTLIRDQRCHPGRVQR